MPTSEMVADADRCYRAVLGRDRRFDGMFFTGVRTTGIYCRPSCPAVTPRRRNVDFFVTAAAAQATGLRACRRCRPDLTPGSPDWDVKADVAGRAMRMIADGVVDREGVRGLAARSGYTTRHLGRVLTEQLGAGPLALARAQRAHTARILIETTNMSLSDVAFAAGFGSLRQFNETVQRTFAATPTVLRQRRRGDTTARPTRGLAEAPAPISASGVITLSLAVREPFAEVALLEFLAARAVTGIEEVTSTCYRRTLRLPLGHGAVELEPSGRSVRCSLELADMRDLASAVERCRRLLDLDADPVAIDAALAGDDLLRGSVEATPGRRLPGHVDGFEVAVRAVVGQQISVSSAATVLSRLVAAHGDRVGHGRLTHMFPTPEALAGVDPRLLPMPRARARTLVEISRAVVRGHLVLDRSADRTDVRHRLLQLPGVGPWTAGYIGMRALGDPDVFLSTDLGARQGLARLASARHGAAPGDGRVDAANATSRAEQWRPWRSYALMHVWAALGTPARHPLVIPSTDNPATRPEGASRDRI